MNVKKSLENRIRGWLPKEPNLPKAATKVNFQVNQQRLPFWKKTDRFGWVLISLALFFFSIAIGYDIILFPGYSQWETVLVLMGCLIGFIFVFYQQRRLNRNKNKQVSLS